MILLQCVACLAVILLVRPDALYHSCAPLALLVATVFLADLLVMLLWSVLRCYWIDGFEIGKGMPSFEVGVRSQLYLHTQRVIYIHLMLEWLTFFFTCLFVRVRVLVHFFSDY